jgi:hypothetical protein
LVTKETVSTFVTKRMNIHYVDANNYNRAEYACIKMSLFSWINCVSAYKELNAFWKQLQMYVESFDENTKSRDTSVFLQSPITLVPKHITFLTQ